MAIEKRDVVIIGGGNAGLGVTVPTRAAGLKVTLIEPDLLGGTCPNRGCTPKKVLVAAAHALDEIERAKAHHIRVGKPRLDWARLIAREKAMIANLPASFAAGLKRRGVEVVKGRAAFAGPDTVTVGRRTFQAKAIVVASGSKPRALPIPGAEHMITSDEVLSDPRLPASVVFVGGGVIAMEFSHVYARAGAKVTVLEALPRLLPALDADAVAQLHAESERVGIKIHTAVKVTGIRPEAGRFRVAFEAGGRRRSILAHRVVNGTGRVADVDGLNLAAAGVKHDGVRILVDTALRSVSNKRVWVCGDALVGTPQLSPLATYEGRLVGRNIVEGPKHRLDERAAPSAVYTVPALASVGLTEAQAQEQGLRFTAHVNDMEGWFSTRTYAEPVAWSKVLVEEKTGRILGAHILGHAGEELIHTFALAMRHNLKAAALRDAVYAFPTFSADIKSMV